MIGPILGGVALFKDFANSVIVFHGNSLILGQSGATVPQGAMPYQVQYQAPVNNLTTCHNKGVGGQTWTGMRSTAPAAVDGLFDATKKKNYLFVWEGSNCQIGQGRTPAQSFADAAAYCAERLAIHPEWIIIHMTTIPAYYQTWNDTVSAGWNEKLLAYNDLLMAGWKSTGAKAIIDVRAGSSPFALADFKRTTFAAATSAGQSIWSPNDQQGGGGTGQNQFVHCSDTGNAVLAQMVAATLRRLPAR